ncbi:hypothetical protein EYV94_18485 [Puteibacter caeruleilacunae]|nr:hypothetical protein EYV94_18485 [Puteibacter caeruleilacunae]
MWLNLIMNPETIYAIYKSELPSLEDVYINQVTLVDGASANLLIDLSEYPKDPPEKWIARQCNTVQIELTLIEIETINIEKWNYDNKGSILVSKDQNYLTFSLEGTFFFRCKWICLNRVSAYQQEEELDNEIGARQESN